MELTYRVVLKDAEPPTAEGREQLKINMMTVLGLDELRASEIVDAAPITLRDGVTHDEAQDFASVLRELGSLVFVEEDDSVPGADGANESSSTKAWYKQPLNIVLMGILASCAMLAASIFLKPCLLYTSPSPRDRG